MKLKVQLIIESDSGETEVVHELAKLERHSLRPESLGLTLSEAKELLQEVQRAMVTHQTTGYVTQQIPCPKCGKIQSRKGKGSVATLQSSGDRLAGCSSWHLRFVVYSSGGNLSRRSSCWRLGGTFAFSRPSPDLKKFSPGRALSPDPAPVWRW